jgi:hypothetical protein
MGADIPQSELTALDYLLRVMRDDRVPLAKRIAAAKAAAPYVHAKPAPISLGGEEDCSPIPIEWLSDHQVEQLLRRLDQPPF